MPYIGKAPVSGGFHKLDSLTASATDTYALTLNSAAYYPETANQLLVSLNGVIQAPQDSFTVSGSNLVFDSALTASDSIDFVMALGDVLGVGTPTDGTITTAKLANQSVTMAKLATSGVLPALDGSALTGIFSTENATFTNQTATTTSSTFQTSNISDSITPSSTSSKILGLFSFTLSFDSYPNSGVDGQYRIMRGTTEVTRRRLNSWTDTGAIPVTIAFLDSPSTTSAVTYTLEYRRVSAYAGNPNVGLGGNSTDLDDEVILLEIKG